MPTPVPLFVVTSSELSLDAVVSAAVGELARLSGRPGQTGGVTTFVGLVRDHHQGRRVTGLDYEAYEPLAVKMFERIAGESRALWPDTVLSIHHRIGPVAIGEASVAIAAASAHRAESFFASRFAIERLKQVAPIWKREYFEGGDTWIEGATVDPDDATAREEARRRACA